MSSLLLHKALKIDEEDDGVLPAKRTKAVKQSLAKREKEMLKQNGDLYELDLDSGELIKKNVKGRIAARKRKLKQLNVNDAKQGHSLLDQYRESRPKNIGLRNQRYLDLIARTKIDEGIINRITEKETVKSTEKKRRREERNDVKSLLRRGNPKKTKAQATSIFSDADFEQVTGPSAKISDNFKRIK